MTVRWGVLGDAKIARTQVIPAIKAAKGAELCAIASRRGELSYNDLLARPDIDAVYIPLPNHLHVEYAIKALEAGKAVLCEKPLGMDSDEVARLVSLRPDLLLAEAFMVRWHPQWAQVEALIAAGRIGKAQLISGQFSYFLDDPENVRNKPGIGGGGLMDVGCYPIYTARRLFSSEPVTASAMSVMHPDYKTDVMLSGTLAFPGARQLSFSCGTMQARHQRICIQGTSGRIEVPVPFNPERDEPTEVHLYEGHAMPRQPTHIFQLQAADQYQLQIEAFGHAMKDPVSWPDSRQDMVGQAKAIEMLFANCHHSAVFEG